MEYRKLGRSGVEVSAVGLGTEYLIDVPRATVVAVVREAMAQGVNYFDLFLAQAEFRDNMGAAFKGYRDGVFLAAHLGAIEENGQYTKSRDGEACERFFLDFLTRFSTDHADVLFLHNSDGEEDYRKLLAPGGLLDMARRFQREGRARLLGFSSHTVETARQAVESGAFDVLMFPINLAGNAVPGRKALLSACVRHGVGVVAMKPFAGGRLLQGRGAMRLERVWIGGEPREIRGSAGIGPVLCLAYALGQVGMSTAVPGCKDLTELGASLGYLAATEKEKDFSGVLSDFQEHVSGECVYCNHCLPCPSGIDIGRTIRLVETVQGSPSAEVRAAYDAMGHGAAECVGCGECEERCPFGVDVISHMERAKKVFG